MDPAVGVQAIRERLQQVVGPADEIREKCGVGSVSFGVLHQGELVFTGSVGFRDVANKMAPDVNTRYTICSISKSFLVAAFGILVDRGKCKWTDPVGPYIPDFKPKDDPRVATEATFNDFFRHSGGLANPVVTIFGPHGKLLVPEEDFLDVLNDTPTGSQQLGPSFNQTWRYSNVAYALLALVVERISGQRYADFISDEILKPLGMTDTIVYKHDLTQDNIAQAYVKLADGTWFKQPNHEWTDEFHTPALAVVGMRSSVRDLLRWCAATLDACWNENENPIAALSPVASNPLRELDAMFDGHYWTRPHADDLQNPCHSHLSWLKCIMPSSMVHCASWNTTVPFNHSGDSGLQEHINRHIMGRASPNKTLFKICGLGFCGTGSVNIFPETLSAVVVLSSGLNKGDPSDFIAAMLMQELFSLQPRVDIPSMVSFEVEARRKEWDTTIDEWKAHRDASATARPPEDYLGDYAGLGMKLTVRKRHQAGPMEVLFNGKEDIVQALEHYAQDMYSYFPLDRDEWLKGAWLDWDYFMVGILHFHRDVAGQVTHLSWMLERGSDPVAFKRLA